MTKLDHMRTLNAAWYQQLSDVLYHGAEVSPRGMLTKELPQRTLTFDMNYPVVTFPARKMGYRFMAAEAWWMLVGRNDVASIAPYSKQIVSFSDDGKTFFGAYGPEIVKQMDYVVRALIADKDTRQACLTTWRQNPPKTRDVPCTIAMDFKIRNGRLNMHVFMRSSDNWLGIPYDAFNFTMVAVEVLRRYNIGSNVKVYLGTCFLTAASSHLYERNFEGVRQIMLEEMPTTAPIPGWLYGITEAPPEHYYTPVELLKILKDVKDDNPKYRWWLR